MRQVDDILIGFHLYEQEYNVLFCAKIIHMRVYSTVKVILCSEFNTGGIFTRAPSFRNYKWILYNKSVELGRTGID